MVRHILNHISYSHVFKFFNNNHYNDSPKKEVIITIIEWIILKLIIFDFVTKKKSTIIQFFVSYVKDGKVCKTTPNPYFFPLPLAARLQKMSCAKIYIQCTPWNVVVFKHERFKLAFTIINRSIFNLLC